ncbi:LOW QUALITY PROTEIN: hypothetical protein M8C21_016842 [Ambrosia artemisiifolia]|uniref:F-box domain-containing protein n=1 Tax=Ambrosia artemisiifolia TaxID=4212 RepID=A0AAD5GMC8_AMBAR|nr:LOW QUALITY PROTEIN: hypothetical protein M8C21_016842 [Ambrosia artemisiifolia]
MVNTIPQTLKAHICFSQDHQPGAIIGSNDDLLTEILLRLPVTSILRFKSVSKHWQLLLTDKHFTQRSSFEVVSNSNLLVSYKEMEDFYPIFLCYLELLSPVYLNGALHWAPSYENFFYFKIDVEQIQTLPFPVEWMPSQVLAKYFGESRGHLHLIASPYHQENILHLNVYEMLSDHSGWVIKYQVQLDALPGAFPDMISRCGCGYHFSVIDVVRGEEEEEEDTFLVLKTPEKIITYNVHDKSFKQIFSSTSQTNKMVSTRAQTKKAHICFSLEDSDHQSTEPGALIGSNDDLLTEILIRLPVTSILRFKSVSKHWRWLLSDRHFTQRYDKLLKCPGVFGRNKYFPFDVENPTPPPFLSLDSYFDHSGIRIMQSCNGLLLCCADRGPTGYSKSPRYYVLNPTTKQLALIPSVPGGLKVAKTILFMGLAFHQTECVHYKVICIRSLEPARNLLQIQVYSSDTRKWKISIESFSARNPVFCKGKGVYWNGALHWAPYSGNQLYFKIDAEQLQTLPLPPVEILPPERSMTYFGESRGSFPEWSYHLFVVDVIRGEKEEDTFLALLVFGRTTNDFHYHPPKLITYNVHAKSVKAYAYCSAVSYNLNVEYWAVDEFNTCKSMLTKSKDKEGLELSGCGLSFLNTKGNLIFELWNCFVDSLLQSLAGMVAVLVSWMKWWRTCDEMMPSQCTDIYSVDSFKTVSLYTLSML